MKKSRFTITTTHYILFSFLIAILVGSVLLTLPISSASGQATPFIDALFTATTATCVTGLVVVPTVSAWSLFGQILNIYGKLIIIATMYLGRVGLISLAIAFNFKREKKNIIKNPTEEISVG